MFCQNPRNMSRLIYVANLSDFMTDLKIYDPNGTKNFTEDDLRKLLVCPNETNEVVKNVDNEISCGDTLQYVAEMYGKLYHPYFAVAVCCFGIFANIINLCILTRREMISVPVNRILTALAVTDILVMLEYIPYVYYYYVMLPKNLDFSYGGAVYILFHVHLTQTLHTSSICLTLFLGIWRCVSLRCSRRLQFVSRSYECTIGIAVSYLLSIILCLPAYITLGISREEIMENRTTYILYHTDLSEVLKTKEGAFMINFWIHAVFVKLLPCVILSMISFLLVETLVKTRRRQQILRSYSRSILNKKNAARCLQRMETTEHTLRTTKMLVAVLVLFLLTELPQGLLLTYIATKGKEMFLNCYQTFGAFMDILALLSGAINFILYCFMNRSFRAAFGGLLNSGFLAWILKIFRTRNSNAGEIEMTEYAQPAVVHL